MSKEVETIQKFINLLVEFCVNYSFQVVGAVIVLAVGYFVAQWLARLLLSVCENKKLDVTLSQFIANIVRFGVLAFAVVIALGKFGITIAPFIAAVGALAFGASLAIQGPLSNYGSGLTIILTRPFVVGDTISVKGETGVVKEVKLAYTLLTDEDGVMITIPNKDIVGFILKNSGPNRIVEGSIGISYASDSEKAIEAVLSGLGKCEGVADKPKPNVGIEAFGDSSVNIGYRYWVPTEKFFQVSYAVNASVYKSVKDAGIDIPFPQRDVRIIGKT
jgi:small conductance mechanosensitive channel